MTKWLNKLTINSDPKNVSCTHDLTKPCLIYKKAGHTFADCSILNNHEFLKTAFTKTCLFFSTVHWAQAYLGVKAMCAQLNMLAPGPSETNAFFAQVCMFSVLIIFPPIPQFNQSQFVVHCEREIDHNQPWSKFVVYSVREIDHDRPR